MSEKFAYGVFAGLIVAATFILATEVRDNTRAAVHQNDYIIQLLSE